MKNDVFWELRRVALVRTDVSEKPSASLIRVTRIGELRTTIAVTINRRTLRRIANSCHPDERGAKFIRNVGFYKSHAA
jgi:DNA-binding TFAR19-related protein (PDSD5 family)